MTHQDRADAASLPGIDDDKRHLGPSRLEDNIPAAADDDLVAGFLCERDNRDMIFEIDVHEEGAFLVREVALHDEEATLQRLRAGLSDRSEHVSLILPPKSPDFDLAAVAEKLAGSVVGGLRHCGSCTGKQGSGFDRRRPMKPWPACGRLIWIKTAARERQVAWGYHLLSDEGASLKTLRQFLSGEDVIQLAIRLGLLALLIIWTFILIRPFVPILAWSAVLAVAFYPVFSWLAK